MKTASFVAILLAIKVFMADLCIWQASGLAGIHNASLYISWRTGERITSRKILNSSLVRSLDSSLDKAGNRIQSRLLKFTLSPFLSQVGHLYLFSLLFLLTSTPCFEIGQGEETRGQVLQKLR